LRSAIAIVALFIVGAPAVAFLLTALVCAGAAPVFGSFCGHNAYIPLLGFTVAAWLALVIGVALRSGRGK
jgi:hypothetical protein